MIWVTWASSPAGFRTDSSAGYISSSSDACWMIAGGLPTAMGSICGKTMPCEKIVTIYCWLTDLDSSCSLVSLSIKVVSTRRTSLSFEKSAQ